MADDEALLAGRRPAVLAGDDLAVGSANAERQRAHQYGAIAAGRSVHLVKADGIGPTGLDGKRAHKGTIS